MKPYITPLFVTYHGKACERNDPEYTPPIATK
jgi:hypothetical protein